MAESRLAERASFFAEVDVLTHGEAMPQRYWGQNLSEAGMFVQTSRSFAPGDRLSLRFDVDAQEVHVRAAEVVWVKPFEPINVDGQLPGVGVRFLSVDPPARAAIRRYVNQFFAPTDASHVPAPPPEPELPEGDYVSLASLRPLSLPPFDSDPPADARMPPPVTLPPTTLVPVHAATPSEPPIGSPTLKTPPTAFGTGTDVPRRASAPSETPPPALSEPSLPPPPVVHEPQVAESRTAEPEARASERPRVSLPPDEPLPTPGIDTEHPLAGWSFQVSATSAPPEQARATSTPPTAPPPDDEEDVSVVSVAPAVPDEANLEISEEHRWSFSSDPPAPSSFVDEQERFDTLEDQEPVHTWPPEKLGLSFSDEGPAARTSLPPTSHALDGADDRIDEVSCPPQAIPRGDQPAPTAEEQRRLDNDFFEGKLSVMELPQTEPRGTRSQRPQRNRAAWAFGLLVAGGLVGAYFGYEPASPPAEPVALEQAAPLSDPKPVAVAEAGLFEAAAQPADAAPATAAPEQAAPAKAEPTKQELTNAVPAKPEPKPKAKAKAAGGIVAEWGRITIPLEGGRVVKAFGLADPPRVVVDLADATFPGHKQHSIGDKGMKEVRFGQPDPAHVRVVVELSGTHPPQDISTLKRSGSLAVAWK